MSYGPVPELLSCHRGTPGLEQHHRHKQPEPSTHWGCPIMAGPCLALLQQNGLGDHNCPCSGSSPWQGGHCGRAHPAHPQPCLGSLGWANWGQREQPFCPTVPKVFLADTWLSCF